uniref:Uncharacterized protein n=1 Tax=viral metagenome TaxID=1070528 RepID=A0A6C0HAB1_9ZZZZ
MADFSVTNTTNNKTNLLADLLAPGAIGVTGYSASGITITSTLSVNPTFESITTGYRYQNTDVGTRYCLKYNTHTAGTGAIDVSNFSTCTIIMCAGGGGGGGGGAPGTGGIGGDGGITIIPNVNIVNAGTINYSVGSAGLGGIGANKSNPFLQIPGKDGQNGGATIVSVSGGSTYTANGGVGGQSPSGNGAAGTITPATQNFTTATLNGPLTYQTVSRVITVSSTNYGQGGSGGGNNSPTQGISGQKGTPGYLRIYLYP